MLTLIKRLTRLLPRSIHTSLRRVHFARQIRAGRFQADEPEAARLGDFLREGDWAIDVGANVGHYTLAMSEIVGRGGRVISFEPMRSTFSVLSANVEFAKNGNVSLINTAASSVTAVLKMDMPTDDATGLENPYQAQIREVGEFSILALPIDALQLAGPVRLVKIDAEGHELDVLKGMAGLIDRCAPAMVIEGDDPEVEAFLASKRYSYRTLEGSWNRIFERQSAG